MTDKYCDILVAEQDAVWIASTDRIMKALEHRRSISDGASFIRESNGDGNLMILPAQTHRINPKKNIQ